MKNTNTDQSKEIEVSNAFHRVNTLLGMVSKDIEAHNNTDFDNIEALIHAIKNEVSQLEGIACPSIDSFETEQEGVSA